MIKPIIYLLIDKLLSTMYKFQGSSDNTRISCEPKLRRAIGRGQEARWVVRACHQIHPLNVGSEQEAASN